MRSVAIIAALAAPARAGERSACAKQNVAS